MSFSCIIGGAKELWLPRQEQRDPSSNAVLSEEMPLAGGGHSHVRYFGFMAQAREVA